MGSRGGFESNVITGREIFCSFKYLSAPSVIKASVVTTPSIDSRSMIDFIV